MVLVGSFVDIDYLDPAMTGGMLGLAELVASGDAAARGALEGFVASACARCEAGLIAGAAELAMSGSPGFIRGAIRSVADTHRGAAVEEMRTPTLVVSGSADPFLGACITASQRLPNAALHVFNRSGHFMPVEVPGELAAVIDDFVQRGVVTAATLQEAVTA